LSGTLGIYNPLRYRGYVYDTETRLYYLQSRYYDPALGRFISADAFASTGQGILGNNMFAYCRNNPVIRKDASGMDDVRVTDANEDDNPLNDYYGKGGAAGGNSSVDISSGGKGNVQNGSSYSTAVNFLKSNGADPQKILPSYNGTPTVKTLQTDTTVYRTWGGTTQELGHWVSPYNYGSDARSLLSLPPGNTMSHTSTFIIPRGTRVLTGEAAPLFGQSGGGIQWWISEVH